MTKKEYNSILRQDGILFLLFIFSPFLSFILCLILLNKKHINIYLILFFAFFAYSMTNIDTEGADLNRYLELPLYCSQYNSFSDLLNSNSFIYEGDYYRSLLGYIISRFSTNGHILMAIVGLIWGIMYIKCRTLFDKYYENNNIIPYIFILLFFFTYGPAHLGNVRFPTAAIIFFYCIIKYIKSKNIKYLLYILLTPLIHSAFIIFITIFIISIFLKNKISSILLLFFFSLIINSDNTITIISNIFTYSPDSISIKIANYIFSDNVITQNEGTNDLSFHVKYMFTLIEYSTIFMICIYKYIKHNSDDNQIICYLLLSYIFYNISPLSKDVNERTLHLSSLISFYLYYTLWLKNSHNSKFILCCIINIISSIPMLYYNIKLMLYFTRIDMIYNSIPLILFSNNDTTFINKM